MSNIELPLDDTLILSAMPSEDAGDVYTVESDRVQFIGTSGRKKRNPRMEGEGDSDQEISNGSTATGNDVSRTAFATVGILFVINLLNYMDRFTIAGE